MLTGCTGTGLRSARIHTGKIYQGPILLSVFMVRGYGLFFMWRNEMENETVNCPKCEKTILKKDSLTHMTIHFPQKIEKLPIRKWEEEE